MSPINDLPPPDMGGKRLVGIDDLPPPPKAESPGTFDGMAKSAINSLPMIGGVIGGIAGSPADVVTGPMGTAVGAGIGGYLGTATKNLINKYYDPQSAPKTTTEALVQPVLGGVEQGLYQGTGEAVAPYIAKGLQSAAEPVSDALKSFAAKKAITATGATGRQAGKFAENAGQELLDQGIVGFGDSQAKVAKKATDALNKSGENISSVIADLDKRGATIDQSDIVATLRKRAAEIGKDPSQFGVSDQLKHTADRIQEMIEAGGGNSKIPLSEAEVTKRGFQSSANYNSAPIDLSHAKEVANIYRQAVEDAATKFDSKAADAFVASKKNYALLKPIEDAAEKRASTLSQSPHGGLLDIATMGAGEAVGGPVGAIVAPIVRRGVVTRIPSTMAATANAAGNLIGGGTAAVESAAPAVAQMSSRIGRAALDSGVDNVVAIPSAAAETDRPKLKGPDSWAKQGAQKLGIQDQEMMNRIMQSPLGKRLLIQASDLTPGSKAMHRLNDQIQKGFGK